MRELGEKAEFDDAFPDKHVLSASQYVIPWIVESVNYVATNVVRQTYRSIRGKSSCMM